MEFLKKNEALHPVCPFKEPINVSEEDYQVLDHHTTERLSGVRSPNRLEDMYHTLDQRTMDSPDDRSTGITL